MESIVAKEKITFAERELRKGLIHWYPFKAGSSVLFVGNKNDALVELFNEKGLSVQSLEREKLPMNGSYDYVISVEDPERCEDPVGFLSGIRRLLSIDGVLLLGMNNRFGIRYFCGDRDPYTERTFDGPDNYYHSELCGESGYKGRMYSRAEIEEMLHASGWEYFGFFSVFPGLSDPFKIISENYTPNEDLTNRIMPVYYYPDTVFLEEERMYEGLKDNGLLHPMANAFLIECSLNKNCLTDALYISTSVERSRENTMLTVILGDGTVSKQAVYEEGKDRIQNLIDNTDNLSKRGIKTVPMELKDGCIIMPEVSAPTGQQHIHEAMKQGRDELFQTVDRFMECVKMSSDIVGEDEIYGPLVRNGYIDLVPHNSFFIEGDYYFFDQEYCVENYPLNVIMSRALFSLFAFNHMDTELENELFSRYGLLEKRDLYQKKELEFLDNIRQEDSLKQYHKRVCRKDRLVSETRLWMDHPGGWYGKRFINIFEGAAGKDCYVFGAGRYAEDFIEKYSSLIVIRKIFDNDSSHTGTCIHGIDVVSSEELVLLEPEKVKIFICMRDYHDVVRQIEKLGIMDYAIYQKGKIYNTGDVDSYKKPYHIV